MVSIPKETLEEFIQKVTNEESDEKQITQEKVEDQ